MNFNRISRRLSLVVLIVSVMVASCRKEDNGKQYSYFISKQKTISYDQNHINALIDAVSIAVPEASSIKPLVNDGIDIYKVVYKSTINGSSINLSGLVCVPVKAGDYPVISFQNGTNTQNSQAPTEFPGNFVYQMVEVIASMGYIVVIADYPGFGESKQIAHPYLVAQPTVRSLVDLLYTVREMSTSELPGISVKNEFYLLGYSQGGWSTLELHKALELDYHNDFNLKGSCCGAGPYNIYLLLEGMVRNDTYPMPVYIGYILNAYSAYHQFTNPVSDIMNEPYASKLPSLFTGQLSSGQINAQLTTSIPALINADFLTGFASSSKYSTVRNALNDNSIAGWHTNIPLLMVHGLNDKYVDPSATENMYAAMIQAGSSGDVVKKVMIPGVDHNTGVAPAMIMGLLFLDDIRKAGN